jgi:hypothetical protein
MQYKVDSWQNNFLHIQVLLFPPSILNKTDRHDITEILLKVVLNTITINPDPPSIKLISTILV